MALFLDDIVNNCVQYCKEDEPLTYTVRVIGGQVFVLSKSLEFNNCLTLELMERYPHVLRMYDEAELLCYREDNE